MLEESIRTDLSIRQGVEDGRRPVYRETSRNFNPTMIAKYSVSRTGLAGFR